MVTADLKSFISPTKNTFEPSINKNLMWEMVLDWTFESGMSVYPNSSNKNIKDMN